SSVRPVVTFNPNWDKIFTTEFLTMTCDVRSPIPADVSYTWYKDNTRIHTGLSFVITDAKTGNSGEYQCESTNTGRSDPIRLDVSHGWLILQAPLYVHEGDNVTLRCHHYPGYTGGETIFYKDNDVIRNWGSDPELHVKDINLITSRGYKCTKQVRHYGLYYQHSAGSSISVRELFTPPEIRVTPSPVIEGDNVTVTCHTNVSPYRPETELHFAFHKDGRNVQGFGPSDQYGVQSAQPEHSGKYHCDVRTVSGRMIEKRSKEFNIEIQESFTHPQITMTPNHMTAGDTMTLTCHTRRSPLIPDTGLEFAFYKDGRKVQDFGLSGQYGVQSAQAKHSGNYSCDVTALSNNLTKSSKGFYVRIQVQSLSHTELFSKPEIEMIPEEVIEGHPMILTCNTSVMRSDIVLQFSFYKNKENIMEFGSSDRYEVPSAQLEDSGNYFCVVRTPTNSVMKRSEEINVDLRGTGNTGLLIILPLALGILLLLVVTLVTLFICCKRRSAVKTQEPTTEGPIVSSDRNAQPEIAYSTLAMHPMTRSAPAGTIEGHENNVAYAAVKSKSRRKPAADPDSIYQNISGFCTLGARTGVQRDGEGRLDFIMHFMSSYSVQPSSLWSEVCQAANPGALKAMASCLIPPGSFLRLLIAGLRYVRNNFL
ncbi:PREDICTED: Fc receptor-like protein 5, partial [Nanorana parkeri]|uniref:Fc receptor-like protein 5 n=1 Tax=Nanorana parkeri TaxID=125878 RepID=UPI000854141F